MRMSVVCLVLQVNKRVMTFLRTTTPNGKTAPVNGTKEALCAVPRSEGYLTDGSLAWLQVNYRGIVRYLRGN